MGKSSKGVRQRKKTSSTSGNDSSVVVKNEEVRRTKTHKSADDVDEEEEEIEEPAWHIIRRHPAFLGMVFLGIPYLIRLLATYVILNQPQLLGKDLRPPVSMTEKRQLLVVGSMSAATTQTAADFQQHLRMEVGHEDTYTKWEFVRDGTVSWFHGIRFMDRSEEEIQAICQVSWEMYSGNKINFFQPWSNYGFGPTLFGPPKFSKFHFDPSFGQAYKDSCQRTLTAEYGCGLRGDGCKTPFETTLIQTRQPWKIVTSLVSKYCYSDSGGASDGQGKFNLPPKSLINFLHTLFPDEQWFAADQSEFPQQPEFDEGDDTYSDDRICAHQMAAYVLRWYAELLDNTNADKKTSQRSSLQMYPIETTPICEVVKMAGLLDESTTVYKPNYDIATTFCDPSSVNATMTFGHTSNLFNKGRLSVEQIQNVVDDQAIISRIKKLYQRMGYNDKDI